MTYWRVCLEDNTFFDVDPKNAEIIKTFWETYIKTKEGSLIYGVDLQNASIVIKTSAIVFMGESNPTARNAYYKFQYQLDKEREEVIAELKEADEESDKPSWL